MELLYLIQKYPSIYRVIKEPSFFAILKALENGGKTFQELVEITMLNPRALEEHIDFLLNNQLIDALYLPNRIEYVLTNFGKRVLELKKKALSPV